jgi:glycosyltransferase involved in cell wall biosynthesis
MRDFVNGREEWPRVTVVTPSLNQGTFLEEAIRSVLLQGYPNVEYIVLDAGSTDGSPEIIRKYEPWLAYWRSAPDEGQTSAISEGWARASGEVLAYINADDAYLPGALAMAGAEFAKNPDVGMVYGTALIVDDEDRLLRQWTGKPFDARTMLTVGNIVPQPATFFSSAAVRAVGGLNHEWEMIMDYDLCFRVGSAFPTVFLENDLAKFRSHEQSKTQTRFEAMAHELLAFMHPLDGPDGYGSQWREVKQRAMSRVHYELAFGYIHYAPVCNGARALRELVSSVALSPRVVARKPLLTAHIMTRSLICLAKRSLGRSPRR